jgi:hypothetical protein
MASKTEKSFTLEESTRRGLERALAEAREAGVPGEAVPELVVIQPGSFTAGLYALSGITESTLKFTWE